MKFLEAFTKDAKYGEVYRKILEPLEEKGETITMCGVADAYIQIGIERGKLQALYELVQKGKITLFEAAEISAPFFVEYFSKETKS